MSLVTGNQLKAARVFAGVDQQQVADAADVNVNTIRNMEARGNEPITSSAVLVRTVQLVLEAWGVEFTNHAGPGVRMRDPRATPSISAKSPSRKQTAKPRRPTRKGRSTLRISAELAPLKMRPEIRP
jgi:DNA-binding XRE family transcriptional regulator